MPSIINGQNIEDIFPEDPTLPSLNLASVGGAEITLPWANSPDNEPIATLTGGCHSSSLESDDAIAPFRTTNAFSQRILDERNLKASLHATIRTGTIHVGGPRFSLDALADTRRSRHDPSYYSKIYGDYYVDNLKLGADAGVLLSSATSSSEQIESLDIKAKLHILWWDIEKNYHTESKSFKYWSEFHITAYDTLTGLNASDQSLDRPPQGVAQNYIKLAGDLEFRVRDEMQKCGLRGGKLVDLDMCHKLCASGLVAEITLMPYSQVRDYMVAINEPG
ncbi:hypothetical protein ANOM_008225 [Aspergillus nomiae NRRL 13137]|uniref:Uncharacterized protein n=1 Tax=Aspergillus nomiae NRRL (strain ATCC 15546 / NRRL 13137 / CBS 260.88 / M93) TaxID=1509407 RepID=A0A0L1IW89_ASPN3|nr:uncharacterized protein ANOM_008225 [Aspergillus nomiae NRRL 13137]KNG83769.1 hypothetical protein ANOM_008225 [Aspergillus nomiae NRRL 13137]